MGKALKGLKYWESPSGINTDKAASYRVSITELKKEGQCSEALEHRQIKYLNNAVEVDNGKLKGLINPVRGFKSLKTAYATIKGFEVMHMFKKGQFNIWLSGQGIAGEIRLITNALVNY